MLTRMYLYSTSTKLSIDVWLYLDRPGSLNNISLHKILLVVLYFVILIYIQKAKCV